MFVNKMKNRTPEQTTLWVPSDTEFLLLLMKNRRKFASSFEHVRNHCDIAATNRAEIALTSPPVYTCDLRMRLGRGKNCIESPR